MVLFRGKLEEKLVELTAEEKAIIVTALEEYLEILEDDFDLSSEMEVVEEGMGQQIDAARELLEKVSKS